MESLTELCDIIANNPKQFLEKLSWICDRCPQTELILSESPRVSRTHLNSVLAIARIMSKNPHSIDHRAKSILIEFLTSVPKSFHRSFWPQSFTSQSISAFYCDFLSYLSCAAEVSPEFGTEVVCIISEVVIAAMSFCDDPSISKSFLSSISQNFPLVLQSDKLIKMLLDQFVPNNDDHTTCLKESVDILEKEEIAFRLITNILEKDKIDYKLHNQARLIAKSQLHLMSAFLKSRKGDCNEQGSVLKTRVSAKLSVYTAAAKLNIIILLSLETDEKTSKKLVMETLRLLLDAVEACLTSLWRKMKACEELFSSLLSGIAKIAVARGGQPLRELLIRLKPLVLAICAQPDSLWSNQGDMFESVLKASCEIVESGLAKDRAPIDNFVVGLASSFRQRNDYQEQVDRENQVPAVQLNVIRLLTHLSVAVKKPDVVDLILPLFIECLEESDALSPLRLHLLDAVSRLATLGFEKSYREIVVLMTRNYLSKLSTLEYIDSKKSTPELIAEYLESFPAGFLIVASGLMDTKLRSDYRHRLLSLCSDVGLSAQSNGGGYWWILYCLHE